MTHNIRENFRDFGTLNWLRTQFKKTLDHAKQMTDPKLFFLKDFSILFCVNLFNMDYKKLCQLLAFNVSIFE